MCKDSILKAACIISQGLWEWTVVPIGLTNVPISF